MRRALGLVLALSFLLPAAASAQTLTVEIDATVDEAPMPARPAAAPPVVRVRPEGDARVAPSMPPAPPPVVVAPPPEPRADEDPEIVGFSSLGLFVEGMDLRTLDLTLRDPEVQALDGVRLDSSFTGYDRLSEQVTGGVTLGIGMRAAGFLRGPEVRLSVGGGEIDGEWGPAIGGPPGMDLRITSMWFLRAELAIGVQLPLGPVTPYVQAIASIGGAFVDVDLRDERLGRLGGETIESELFGAGLEAGVDVELEEGIAMGFAFRGNFVGTPSFGGLLRFGFTGE